MKYTLILSLLMLLTGCVVQKAKPQEGGALHGVNKRQVQINQRQDKANQRSVFQSTEPNLVMRTQPVITVNEYSRNLVHELMALNHALDDGAYVGVTDLTFVDSDLLHGNVLSNHLSEAIIYDLHKFGVPVLDFKVTDYVRVTDSGDFALSRDFTELSAQLPIKYVVTGTMTQHKMGLLINARLVQINNKKVISVARTFIPSTVVQALLQYENEQQLKFKQG